MAVSREQSTNLQTRFIEMLLALLKDKNNCSCQLVVHRQSIKPKQDYKTLPNEKIIAFVKSCFDTEGKFTTTATDERCIDQERTSPKTLRHHGVKESVVSELTDYERIYLEGAFSYVTVELEKELQRAYLASNPELYMTKKEELMSLCKKIANEFTRDENSTKPDNPNLFVNFQKTLSAMLRRKEETLKVLHHIITSFIHNKESPENADSIERFKTILRLIDDHTTSMDVKIEAIERQLRELQKSADPTATNKNTLITAEIFASVFSAPHNALKALMRDELNHPSVTDLLARNVSYLLPSYSALKRATDNLIDTKTAWTKATVNKTTPRTNPDILKKN